ncbi:Phospholipase A2 domain-containing protein [Aphelenchoides bicaudatus]|nr:Phospholipase A2 domain-containing protein [Aphelenchoides bicaudatus]
MNTFVVVLVLLLVEFVYAHITGYECGSGRSEWLGLLANLQCPRSIPSVNACCKTHDQCYADQLGRGFCDTHFCMCVKNATQQHDCQKPAVKSFCRIVRILGQSAYDNSASPSASETTINFQFTVHERDTERTVFYRGVELRKVQPGTTFKFGALDPCQICIKYMQWSINCADVVSAENPMLLPNPNGPKTCKRGLEQKMRIRVSCPNSREYKQILLKAETPFAELRPLLNVACSHSAEALSLIKYGSTVEDEDTLRSVNARSDDIIELVF